MNAVSPLSLSPPMFLVNLDLRSDTLQAITDTRRFCINFLGLDQVSVCQAFSRKGPEKFADVEYRRGSLGVPVLEGCIAYIECTVASIQAGGDHAIVIGDAREGAAPGGSPLGYFTSKLHELAPYS